MAKSIIKEIIIVLLLLLAILLVLGVFLYDYIPTNKIIPKVERYQVPNSIKEEVSQTINEEEEQEKMQIVYEIDGTDLKNYEKSKDYQKGKVNPFAQDTNDNSNNNNSNSNNSNNNNNNSNNNNNNNNNNINNNNSNNNSNSGGNYLPNTGTK